MTQDSNTEQPSIAARLETRANAFSLDALTPPTNSVGPCPHVTVIGEAPEIVRRWITLEGQIADEYSATRAAFETWVGEQGDEATESVHEEAKRRSAHAHQLVREHQLAHMVCAHELRLAFPDADLGAQLGVNSDWNVIQIMPSQADLLRNAIMAGAGGGVVLVIGGRHDDTGSTAH